MNSTIQCFYIEIFRLRQNICYLLNYLSSLPVHTYLLQRAPMVFESLS